MRFNISTLTSSSTVTTLPATLPCPRLTMSRPPSTDTPPPIDQYRTLPNALKRPLLRFTASQPLPPDRTTSQTLFDLSSTSYTARLASRNVLLENPVPVGAEKAAQEGRDDALRRGKKRPAGTEVDSSLTEGKGKRRRRGKVGLMGREEASGCGIWQVGKGIPIRCVPFPSFAGTMRR